MKDIFQSLDILKQNVKILDNFEEVYLEKAKNRILFEDIYSKKNLPAFDNAALDGYAFRFCDKDNDLNIKGTILAGDKNDYFINENECYKIMTGAKMPKNADTILMIENESIKENKLLIKKDIKKFNAYRFKGEELKENELILKKGEKLDASKIALLASQGIYKIKVFKKVKIGIFSSGNELKEPWEQSDENSIYNINAYSIRALLDDENCEIFYFGILKDDLDSIKESFSDLNYDLLITSGGASVGEADFVKEIFNDLKYENVFDGVKARPARPTKVFKKNNSFALILPGNPMAAFLSSFLFGKKIINLFLNNNQDFKIINTKIKTDLKLKAGRNNIILGNLKDGYFEVFNDNKFGSGMIIPLIKTDSFIISNENQDFIKANEEVKAIIFS